MRILIFALIVAALAGCAAQITPEQLRNADYGPMPSEGHQDVIRAHFARTLIDPTSPLYEFTPPRRGYTAESPVFGTETKFGWIVCGRINGKNRMGGYAGWAPFYVLMRGNRVEFSIIGDSRRDSFRNGAIRGACRR